MIFIICYRPTIDYIDNKKINLYIQTLKKLELPFYKNNKSLQKIINNIQNEIYAIMNTLSKYNIRLENDVTRKAKNKTDFISNKKNNKNLINYNIYNLFFISPKIKKT